MLAVFPWPQPGKCQTTFFTAKGQHNYKLNGPKHASYDVNVKQHFSCQNTSKARFLKFGATWQHCIRSAKNTCRAVFLTNWCCWVNDRGGRRPESVFQTPTPLYQNFESGSGCRNFSNLRVRLLFRLRLVSSIQPKFTDVFT